jgi:N-acetylneuraminate epimerase
MIRLVPFLYMTALATAAEPLVWKQLPPLPDPLGVAAPFAGVSDGSLVVAGGANFPDRMPWEGGKKVWHDRVWVLDKPDGKWRDGGKLPRPLGYGISLMRDDGFLCIGGSDAEVHHADVFHATMKDGNVVFAEQAPLPIPLANGAGAISDDGTAYVVGGNTEPGEKSASDRVFALAPKATEWHELPPIPGGARILPISAGAGMEFFVFGGAALEARDGKIVRRYLHDAWRYSAAQGWRRLADLPKACVAAPSPAPSRNGKIYLIGGDDGTRAGFQPVEKHPGFPGSVLVYDIAADSWTEEGKTPAPRATVPVTSIWRGQFVIPSGEVRPGVRSPEVWTFTK